MGRKGSIALTFSSLLKVLKVLIRSLSKLNFCQKGPVHIFMKIVATLYHEGQVYIQYRHMRNREEGVFLIGHYYREDFMDVSSISPLLLFCTLFNSFFYSI